jgi:hypothetical protein
MKLWIAVMYLASGTAFLSALTLNHILFGVGILNQAQKFMFSQLLMLSIMVSLATFLIPPLSVFVNYLDAHMPASDVTPDTDPKRK